MRRDGTLELDRIIEGVQATYRVQVERYIVIDSQSVNPDVRSTIPKGLYFFRPHQPLPLVVSDGYNGCRTWSRRQESYGGFDAMQWWRIRQRSQKPLKL